MFFIFYSLWPLFQLDPKDKCSSFSRSAAALPHPHPTVHAAGYWGRERAVQRADSRMGVRACVLRDRNGELFKKNTINEKIFLLCHFFLLCCHIWKIFQIDFFVDHFKIPHKHILTAAHLCLLDKFKASPTACMAHPCFPNFAHVQVKISELLFLFLFFY